MILKNSSHGHDSQIKKESDQDLQEKKKKDFHSTSMHSLWPPHNSTC